MNEQKMCDPENEPRYQLCKVCGAKDCDCTIKDLRNFQAGAASRDAEIQRLQFALADSEALELGTAERCDQLRAELAAALAACKVKDEALTSLTIHRESAISSEYEAAEEALAIQPDDAALKAWLGEPVSFLYKHNSSFGDGHFWTHRPTHNGVAALETKALYSPKELK